MRYDLSDNTGAFPDLNEMGKLHQGFKWDTVNSKAQCFQYLDDY